MKALIIAVCVFAIAVGVHARWPVATASAEQAPDPDAGPRFVWEKQDSYLWIVTDRHTGNKYLCLKWGESASLTLMPK